MPSHVVLALNSHLGRTDTRIIEPYIDGTEFSVDGWIHEDAFFAIVQHKLSMVERTFIGDGPTVSPPANSACLLDGWSRLNCDEEVICRFGRTVLDAIGFSRGVYHIEGREQHPEGRLSLIKVNPRAPGGSLWKTALLRTGYDLELVDATIQLGETVSPPGTPTGECVLHYPFYAANSGILSDWGDLAGPALKVAKDVTIDFVAQLGDSFSEEDLSEEPYLAFAVAHDTSMEGLLGKCQAILGLSPPRIRPFS